MTDEKDGAFDSFVFSAYGTFDFCIQDDTEIVSQHVSCNNLCLSFWD